MKLKTNTAKNVQLNPPTPKEHGAWGMLLVPFVMGVGVVGHFTIETLWLLAAVLLAFLSQKPFAQLLTTQERISTSRKLKRSLAWFGIYAGSSAAIFLILYVPYQMKGLRLFGFLGSPVILAYSYFVWRKAVRSVLGELAGIAGLTMTGPMACYAAAGEIRAVGFWLWAFCILYFVSSIFYVKAVVQKFLRLKSGQPSSLHGMEWACLLYHLGMIGVLLALFILRILPLTGLLAFLPVAVRGLQVSFKTSGRLNFAIIGWSEVGYSIFFAIFLVAGLRSSEAVLTTLFR
ncbi:MAG: YwiC-like family protein [Terriglobia bacterium]